VRASEVDVGTREARTQDSDELAAATRAGGVDGTQVAGADATRAAGVGNDATRIGVDGTQVAGAGGATVAAGAAAGATRMGTAPEADTASLPAAATGTGTATPAGRVAPALIAAVAVGVIVLAVVGYLVGSSGSKGSKTPANNSSASAGPLTITFPDTWQRVESAPPIPGLAFQDPISLAPKGGPAVGALTAGTTASSDATLLPAAFKKSLSTPAPKGDPVSLGDLEAYRYTGLKPKNYPQELTVYTVPTDGGVATIACSAAPAQAASFLPECERAASTLTLSGIESVDLGVPKAYATSLNGAITKLQSSRKAALAKLKAARTPAAQASAARQAVAAYGAAAKSVAGQKVPPQLEATNTAIVAALRRGQSGYGAMAAAAAGGDRGGYLTGTRAVKQADAALAKALQSLGQAS
jgi:hypothetical protein